MKQTQISYRALFASGMIGIAIIGFCYGDFASMWQGAPKWIPVSTHVPIAYAASVLMLLTGLGLLIERSAAISARVLFFYLVLWALLLRVPIVLTTPQIEVNWEGLSEGAVMLAGAWVLFAGLAAPSDGSQSSFITGERGTRLAQILFGLAMLPLGLSHFVYVKHTADLVPSYLPYHTGWAYFTGVAHLAAGFGLLLSIVPRLAVTLEATMLTAFTILVWIPMIVAAPHEQGLWSEITVSWAISAAAWVVAASITTKSR